MFSDVYFHELVLAALFGYAIVCHQQFWDSNGWPTKFANPWLQQVANDVRAWANFCHIATTKGLLEIIQSTAFVKARFSCMLSYHMSYDSTVGSLSPHSTFADISSEDSSTSNASSSSNHRKCCCAVCDRCFDTLRALRLHATKMHVSLMSACITNRCPFCKGAFKTLRAARDHLRRQSWPIKCVNHLARYRFFDVHGLPSYLCPVCAQSFSCHDDYASHVVQHFDGHGVLDAETSIGENKS